jgi:hypothetical protein
MKNMSRKRAVEVVTLNLPGMLAALTGTRAREWKLRDGPDSGCGVDYYYGHRQGNEAYINIDQGHFAISVAGETLFTGDPAEDPRLKRCVSEY